MDRHHRFKTHSRYFFVCILFHYHFNINAHCRLWRADDSIIVNRKGIVRRDCLTSSVGSESNRCRAESSFIKPVTTRLCQYGQHSSNATRTYVCIYVCVCVCGPDTDLGRDIGDHPPRQLREACYICKPF